ECFVNDGCALPFCGEASIDLVWSYDSFVHIEKSAIQSYFHEFARVLRPGGKAVIHHAGRRHATLPLGFLRRLSLPGRWTYQVLSMKRDTDGGRDGDRSHVSRELVLQMARRAGLAVLQQTDSWGEAGEFNCRRFNDAITILRRPNRADP
ncbi:MAG: class I SAM-dependent methyltransferase, partial [Planctomycetota bacterium]